MPLAYLMTWTESERGWGQRPDGHSLHATKADWEAYLAKHNAQKTTEVPDEYSFPEGELVGVDVDQAMLTKLTNAGGSLRYWARQLVFDMSETGTRFVREASATAA